MTVVPILLFFIVVQRYFVRGLSGAIRVTDPILSRVMLAFEGFAAPPAMVERLGRAPAASVTLFQHGNVGSPEQVRSLCASLQSAADGGLLIAADQEGGQFIALGDGSAGVRREHGARRGRRRRADRAVGRADRRRGAGDGRERRLRAGVGHRLQIH